MKKSAVQRLGAATGVVAGLLTGVSASAVTVYTQSDFVNSGPDIQFVALEHQELHRPPRVLFNVNLGGFPNGPHGATFDAPTSFDSFAVFGRSASGGVFVAFSQSPFGVGESFESLFPGVSEAALYDAIAQGGPLVDSFAEQLAQNAGNVNDLKVACKTTHFSIGTDFGTFQASFVPVPEPVGFAAIGLAAGLCRRTRR